MTSAGVDAKAYLGGWMSALVHMYSVDIRAIPEDKWTGVHGGCTRSACDLTADAIGMLHWTTGALQGNTALPEGSNASAELKDACATRDGAAASLAGASHAFVAALNAASDEALNAMVTPPWRMDTPLFMLAQIAVSHVWYHDGQLNYIQTLLGDDKVHWMGD